MKPKPDHPADHVEKSCPVCGASDLDGCRALDRLGTRSIEADHRHVCPVCGSDYTLLVWIRGYKMCGLCAENFEQALRILRHKHHKRLNRILLSLDKTDV
jgi:hypothetical protein